MTVKWWWDYISFGIVLILILYFLVSEAKLQVYSVYSTISVLNAAYKFKHKHGDTFDFINH